MGVNKPSNIFSGRIYDEWRQGLERLAQDTLGSCRPQDLDGTACLPGDAGPAGDSAGGFRRLHPHGHTCPIACIGFLEVAVEVRETGVGPAGTAAKETERA